jgi:hypothetical protein
MIITAKNYIDTATLASTDGYNSLQDVNNLKIPQLSKNFIMNTSGVVTLSGVSTINAIMIDKGNCTSISAAITYVDTTTYSISLTMTDTVFYHFLDQDTGNKNENIDHIHFTFVGPSTGTAEELLPRVGYIFVGEYLQLPAIDPTAGIYYSTTSQKTNSISGQQYTDSGYQYVSTTFTFPRIPDTSEVFLGKTVAGRQEILAAWRETEFQYSWLWPWENDLDKVPPIFGSMDTDSLQFDRVDCDGIRWSLSLGFREIK